MEYNDPSRRQYAQNQSLPGSVERFRQSSYVQHQQQQQQQSPTTNTVPSTGRAGSDAHIYGFAQGAPPAQPMQYAADLQQNPDVPRQQQDSAQLPQYGGPDALYGMGQPPTPQYYLAGEPIATSATAPEMAAPHLPSQYQSAAYAPAGPSSSSSSSQLYGSNMIDPSHQHPAYASYSQQYAPTPAPQSADQAFRNYQAQMRSIFSQVRGGSLREVGSLLLEASLYLIGNAEALGLTRDDDNLHDDRIRLWDEFNRSWLVTLQKQFDMAQDSLSTGQPIREPQSIMTAQTLEHLSRELVRLCDSVEKHGLVDYQMGVAEEEIMDLLLRCLAQLDRKRAPTAEASSSASATTHGR